MKTSPAVPCGEGPRSLAELATDVRMARRVVHDHRMAPVVREELAMAHHMLRQALEAYASELTLRRLPIPYRLRDDLRLQRDVGTSERGRHDITLTPPAGTPRLN